MFYGSNPSQYTCTNEDRKTLRRKHRSANRSRCNYCTENSLIEAEGATKAVAY